MFKTVTALKLSGDVTYYVHTHTQTHTRTQPVIV